MDHLIQNPPVTCTVLDLSITVYMDVFQVSARKLKPHPPQPRSLHERIMEEIRTERELRPVSPDMMRRSRLG